MKYQVNSLLKRYQLNHQTGPEVNVISIFSSVFISSPIQSNFISNCDKGKFMEVIEKNKSRKQKYFVGSESEQEYCQSVYCVYHYHESLVIICVILNSVKVIFMDNSG